MAKKITKAEKKKTCFIIMPISTPEPFLDKYRDREDHFKHVLDCLFIPSVEKAGFEAIPPMAKGADLIQAEIIRNLEQSDLVLCDMSCLNPNVFFEFGIRTSLNKPVCLVKDEHTKEVPFDPAILNHQEYRGTIETWEIDEEIEKLADHIKTSEERSEQENTLWKYFGIRTAAKAYEGETGPDAKIDYLITQTDALRHQVGTLRQMADNPSLPTELNISRIIRDRAESSSYTIQESRDYLKYFLANHRLNLEPRDSMSDSDINDAFFKKLGEMPLKERHYMVINDLLDTDFNLTRMGMLLVRNILVEIELNI